MSPTLSLVPSRLLGDARADAPPLAEGLLPQEAGGSLVSDREVQVHLCSVSPGLGSSWEMALPLPLPPLHLPLCLLQGRIRADSDMSPFPWHLA